MTRPPARAGATLLAAALAALALPAAAQARGSISYDGTTMTFTGDAALDAVGVGVSQGDLSWTSSGGLDAVPAQCEIGATDTVAYCPFFPQRIVVRLGGGNDGFSIDSVAWDPFPPETVVEAHGEDGDDRIQSAALQFGGPGRDRLEGHDGDQELHGGPGDDVLDGGAGSDRVHGEDGNDLLNGDQYKAPGADLIDGGAGEDAIEGEWVESEQKATAPVAVTLDGQANDGRPGEGDNVVGVERFKVHAGGTFVGTEAADVWEVEPGELRANATVVGNGGNDRLVGDDDVEAIDGGPGDDYVEGGWNDDTLVGGPGRDTVFADETGANCGYWTWCRLPFGNDTVDVRDGEVDSVDCGIGTDTVKADPVDVLSNCEQVDTGAAPRPGPGPERRRGGDGPVPGRRAARVGVTVPAARLAAALRGGLLVRIAAPGAGTARVTVRRGRATVASGTARVRRAGRAAVRARFTRAGRRALRGARSARLTVSVRFAPRRGAARSGSASVTLRR